MIYIRVRDNQTPLDTDIINVVKKGLYQLPIYVSKLRIKELDIQD